MSLHEEPYANGFGILVGIAILWIGTLAIVWAGKAGYEALWGDEKKDGAATEQSGEGGLQGRGPADLLGPNLRIG